MANAPTMTALIVAAGSGERFGSTTPKQYLPLLGKTVLRHSIDVFLNHPQIKNVIVAIHPDHIDLYKNAVIGLDLPDPIMGGASRQETVKKSLAHIQTGFVLVHDGARPCLSPDTITHICHALSDDAAVIPTLKIQDTLRRQYADRTTETVSRDHLFAMQTPQGFLTKKLKALHEKYADTPVTDDAALFEADGLTCTFVLGHKDNIKITTPDNLYHAEQILSEKRGDIRTGTGYDVHRLIPQEAGSNDIRLGGIDIPHEARLDGHSDADVVLHALTDALLATICDGDIGMHFPPSDPQWKGKDSAAFLKHAGDLIQKQNGIITHIDTTIICEAPKIGAYRDQMRARIAEILSMPITRVSIKATTTERLGFTGRKEGIAAKSVVTVRLPFQSSTLQTNSMPLTQKEVA